MSKEDRINKKMKIIKVLKSVEEEISDGYRYYCVDGIDSVDSTLERIADLILTVIENE